MYTSKKHYLHATKTLIQAIGLNDGPLKSVEGLVDLRNELENHRTQLYNKMIEELNKHLYTTSSTEVLTNFQREGSARNSNFASPFQRNIIRRSAERAEVNTKIRKVLFEMAQRSDTDTTEILENTDLLDPDLNATYFLGIIIECIALLNKVPESLEVSLTCHKPVTNLEFPLNFQTIKTQIQSELSAVVTRTTQHLVAMNTTLAIDTNGDKTITHPLLELVELTYKQFKLIADAHTMLLKNFLSVTQRHSIVVKPYDIADYWTHAQAVVRIQITSQISNYLLDS